MIEISEAVTRAKNTVVRSSMGGTDTDQSHVESADNVQVEDLTAEVN